MPLVALSVTDQTSEARYPSFKGIMAAKKKPVETYVSGRPRRRGRPGRPGGRVDRRSKVTTERPPRSAGTIVTDEDGSGADTLVEFLAGQKFI